MFELISNFNAIKTSMLVDKEKDRPLELDSISGAVLRRCELLGGRGAVYCDSGCAIAAVLYVNIGLVDCPLFGKQKAHMKWAFYKIWPARQDRLRSPCGRSSGLRPVVAMLRRPNGWRRLSNPGSHQS